MDSSGQRERKRLDLYRRIAESGLRLFVEQGYDATTLDMIAQDAGIARRTFFSYFKTKDEIVRAWSNNGWDLLLEDLRGTSPDRPPISAIRDVLDRGIGRSNDALLRAIAKITAEHPALAATQHASYAEREKKLYEVLCEVWRQPARRPALRLAAMVAMGVLRVAVEAWQAPGNTHSLQRCFRNAFALLPGALLEEGR